MTKGGWIAIAVGIAVAVSVGGPRVFKRASEITNFEECAEAGNLIGESYPRQCWTEDGGHFIEVIDVPLPTVPSGLPSETPNPSEEPIFCTADAMQCPDGSWVGRTGPQCEFVCSE